MIIVKPILIVGMLTIILFVISCNDQKKINSDLIIGAGKMPNLARDVEGNFHVVFGIRDSIMYTASNDKGQTFSPPAVIDVLPELVASSMRGPQIAVTGDGLTVIAVNKAGDIFSFSKTNTGQWSQPTRVNDIDTVAKEGLMALGADGSNAFAVWLDLRDKHNEIVGAKSTDGGNTWSKNILVYASPDTTVCECCKPSVAVKGSNIYVMFRNHLYGNRDLHLIQSTDGGNSFGKAEQLGKENWALDGCPMDGGGMAINNDGILETVWRRRNTIYACVPGQPETAIGEGKGCSMEPVNGKNVYAWTQNGEIIIRKPQGMKVNLGKGQLPLIKSVNKEHILCVWENENQVHAQIVSL